MSSPRSRLTYDAFVRLFEEGRREQYEEKRPDARVPVLSHGHLSPSDALDKLEAKVAKNKEILQKVIVLIPSYNP